MQTIREGYKEFDDEGGIVWALIRHDGDVDHEDVVDFAMYESDTAITEPYNGGPGCSFAGTVSSRLGPCIALVKQTVGMDI